MADNDKEVRIIIFLDIFDSTLGLAFYNYPDQVFQ
jgi:hypothetical protein